MRTVTNAYVPADHIWDAEIVHIAPTDATQEECTRLLAQVERLDRALFNELEAIVNACVAEVFEIGFVAGWNASQDPTPYIFKLRTPAQ